MPFAVAEHEGILHLTLDTPGSAINIFNHATAHQLIDILAQVKPATTRAIVFETAKPNSFINGVGLLLAHASQTHDDLMRASTPPWDAYRAVHDAPVPTIAVIQGSCFGCGVEFALNCDYRIATDTCETEFYMTELNDYLFIPLFGSTWNLPEAVGLGDAVDLLLWGDRWKARKACERGLIDEVVPHDALSVFQERFVRNVLNGTQVSRRRGRVRWSADEDAVVERARKRILSLPPAYHHVYSDALQLLQSGAQQIGSYVEHQERELACSATSALSPIGKAAYAFFYLRQMASQRAVGRARVKDGETTLALMAGERSEARALIEELRTRKLPGVRISAPENAEFRLVAAPGEVDGAAHDIVLRGSFHPKPEHSTEVYTPFWRSSGRLVELAVGEDAGDGLNDDDIGKLVRILQRFGWEVARTAAREIFVTNRLLLAYLGPALKLVHAGARVDTLNGELRHAGFGRRPHAVIAALDRTSLAGALASTTELSPRESERLLTRLDDSRYSTDEPGSLFMDALCVSLLDAVLTTLAQRETRDTSTIDLIAREALDFPRHLTSLCTWLKKERLARALERSPSLASIVTPAAVAAAQGFVANGREFYR